MSPRDTKQISVIISKEKDERIKRLAETLDLSSSKMYQWLVCNALEIVESEEERPEIPELLSVLRGIHRKHREMNQK